MIGRILLTLVILAITGFVLLVLIGLWGRHEQEITDSLSRIYEQYLASPAGPSSSPRATFREQPKLVGTGAVGSSSQGMSVALSADGNTGIVGGPGPNNADRERPASIGPDGAAWEFARRGDVWTQHAKVVGNTSDS